MPVFFRQKQPYLCVHCWATTALHLPQGCLSCLDHSSSASSSSSPPPRWTPPGAAATWSGTPGVSTHFFCIHLRTKQGRPSHSLTINYRFRAAAIINQPELYAHAPPLLNISSFFCGINPDRTESVSLDSARILRFLYIRPADIRFLQRIRRSAEFLSHPKKKLLWKDQNYVKYVCILFTSYVCIERV